MKTANSYSWMLLPIAKRLFDGTIGKDRDALLLIDGTEFDLEPLLLQFKGKATDCEFLLLEIGDDLASDCEYLFDRPESECETLLFLSPAEDEVSDVAEPPMVIS